MEWLVALQGVLWSEEGAGWAQFAAACLALYIAVRAPIWHADRAGKMQAATQVRAILAIAEDAFGMVAAVPTDPDDAPGHLSAMTALPHRRAKMVITWLRAIQIHSLYDHRLAAPTLDLARGLDALRLASINMRRYNDQQRATFSTRAHPFAKPTCEQLIRCAGLSITAIKAMREVASEYPH